LSVVLDVVYNHLGPAGNTLPVFSGAYFDAQRTNPWGQAPALEKPAFRRLILSNAAYWLNTFGIDGLRLDATHELEPAALRTSSRRCHSSRARVAHRQC